MYALKVFIDDGDGKWYTAWRLAYGNTRGRRTFWNEGEARNIHNSRNIQVKKCGYHCYTIPRIFQLENLYPWEMFVGKKLYQVNIRLGIVLCEGDRDYDYDGIRVAFRRMTLIEKVGAMTENNYYYAMEKVRKLEKGV